MQNRVKPSEVCCSCRQQALGALQRTVLSNIDHACRAEPSEDQNNKRKRFSDEQLAALTDLADEANWSLLSVAKEVREQFCSKYEISKVCSVVAHHAHASQAVSSLAAMAYQLVEQKRCYISSGCASCCTSNLMPRICTGSVWAFRCQLSWLFC